MLHCPAGSRDRNGVVLRGLAQEAIARPATAQNSCAYCTSCQQQRKTEHPSQPCVEYSQAPRSGEWQQQQTEGNRCQSPAQR